ncbi:hypothetical protein YQE_06455, partial [Dendroctonus ponderosae]
MGHSHSSSHKRLRSISSSRYGAEFTEVVDLEFSDTSVYSEPVGNSSENKSVKPVTTNLKHCNKLNSVPEEMAQIQYPKDLLLLDDHVKEIADQIDTLSSEEFFVYFPSLKDDLHNCWQKVYSIREENSEIKLKKHAIIDSIRESLKKLNIKLQQREFGG